MENQVEEITCCVTTCGLPLNAEYWDTQYRNNETCWDLHQVSPPIKEYFDQVNNKNISIFNSGLWQRIRSSIFISTWL